MQKGWGQQGLETRDRSTLSSEPDPQSSCPRNTPSHHRKTPAPFTPLSSLPCCSTADWAERHSSAIFPFFLLWKLWPHLSPLIPISALPLPLLFCLPQHWEQHCFSLARAKYKPLPSKYTNIDMISSLPSLYVGRTGKEGVLVGKEIHTNTGEL